MTTQEFNKSVRALKWQFCQEVEGHRADLYRFCRSLTRNPFDAEDLVQETLLRAFAKSAEQWHEVKHPKAYLFRTASNLWIDTQRRMSPDLMDEWVEPAGPPVSESTAFEVRDAVARLAANLPPRERTVVLLKDVFDFQLDEIASMLVASLASIKAALHRGREKLAAVAVAAAGDASPPRRGARSVVSKQFLDRFAVAFNTMDIDQCAALFLSDATAEVVGVGVEYGLAAMLDKNGALGQTFADQTIVRVAAHDLDDRRFLVVWHRDEGGAELVRDIVAIEEAHGACSRFSMYYFAPEVLTEVCAALRLPCKTQGRCMV